MIAGNKIAFCRALRKQNGNTYLEIYTRTQNKKNPLILDKFLHLAQPLAIKLREIGQNYGDVHCKRCGGAEKIQIHWLFSGTSL